MRQKPRTTTIHEAQQNRLLMARETVLVARRPRKVERDVWREVALREA